MKILFGFLFGIGLGFGIVYWYESGIEVKEADVLSESISATPTVSNPENIEDGLSEMIELASGTSGIEETITVTTTAIPTKKPLSPTKVVVSNTPTTSPTPEVTLTLTNIPTPTTANTPTPTVATIQQTVYSQEEINGFINSFAGQYGVSSDVLRHIAICESGLPLNPLSMSPNGQYAGLFQFSVGAWNNYRGQIGESADQGLRFDAEEAVQTAAYVLAINQEHIWPSCLP